MSHLRAGLRDLLRRRNHINFKVLSALQGLHKQEEVKMLKKSLK
jgi:hypothetical protein